MPPRRLPALPTLGPQDRNAQLLCRLALSDVEILNWLRGTGRSEILRDVSGADLLSIIWTSTSDLSDPMKLAAFLSSLNRDEEMALSAAFSCRSPCPKAE